MSDQAKIDQAKIDGIQEVFRNVSLDLAEYSNSEAYEDGMKHCLQLMRNKIQTLRGYSEHPLEVDESLIKKS